MHATACKIVSPSLVVGPCALALLSLSHAGGTLAVAFWPSQVEEQGPWQRLAHLSTSKPKPFTESSHKQPVKVQL